MADSQTASSDSTCLASQLRDVARGGSGKPGAAGCLNALQGERHDSRVRRCAWHKARRSGYVAEAEANMSEAAAAMHMPCQGQVTKTNLESLSRR